MIEWEKLNEIRDFANAQLDMLKFKKAEANSPTEMMCISFAANCIVDIMDEITELLNNTPH